MDISKEEFNKLRETELAILVEFDRVCREIGINYSLSSGTLLGAVRHGGFIPWDDDIDVAMLREDYNKFVDAGQDLLPDYLFIQTHDTDKNHFNAFGKIRDTSTVLKEYSTQKFEMEHGVYIDIFPIDRASTNRIIRKIDNLLLTLVRKIQAANKYEWIEITGNPFKKAIKKMMLPFFRCFSINKLNRIETHIRSKNNKRNNKYTYGDRYLGKPSQLKDSMLIPIEVFNHYCDIEFEGFTFKAIKDWDVYLSSIYGDYMELPPEHERISKHNFVELKFNVR